MGVYSTICWWQLLVSLFTFSAHAQGPSTINNSHPTQSTLFFKMNTMATTTTTNYTDTEEVHCTRGALLGPFGLIVQGSLAVVAFGALVVKRFCEPKHDRRVWKIWAFDTSKQAVGAAVVHFANVFLADMFTGDPCTWYIVSFLLDSTIGLLIICIGLKISLQIALKKQWTDLYFGEYGKPARLRPWAIQTGVYMGLMVFEKLLMTLLVMFKFWEKVRKLIMYPIKDPRLELIIVMFIVPFFINAFIFWVVDNYLKKSIKRSTRSSLIHHTNGNADIEVSGDSSVLYSSGSNKGRRYKRCPAEDEESEADVLLGSSVTEEDAENTSIVNSNNTLSLLVGARTAMQPNGAHRISVGSDDVTILDTNDQKCLLTD